MSPDCDLIMLPAADKKAVYDMFEVDIKAASLPVPKLTYFCKVWRTDEFCSKMKIRKWLRFAKCGDCIDYRKRRAEATSKTIKNAIKEEERLHHRWMCCLFVFFLPILSFCFLCTLICYLYVYVCM